jgi:hypothetical protein
MNNLFPDKGMERKILQEFLMMNRKNVFLIGLSILLQTAFAVQGVHANGIQPKPELPPPLVKLEPTDALYQSVVSGTTWMPSRFNNADLVAIISVGSPDGCEEEDMINTASVVIEEMHRQFQEKMPGDKTFALVPEETVQGRRQALRLNGIARPMKNYTTQEEMVRQIIKDLNADYGIVGQLGDGGVDWMEYDNEGKKNQKKEVFDPRKSNIVFQLIHGFPPPAMPNEQRFLKFPDGVSIVSLAYGTKDVLYAVDDTNTISSFNATTGELKRKIAETTAKIYMIASSGNTVIAACEDGVRIYNAETTDNPKIFPVGGAALALAYNNGHILVGTQTGDVGIYDENGIKVLSLPRQRGPVNVVDFGGADGSTLLYASGDGGLNIYDSVTGAPLGSVRSSGMPLLTAKFSPNQQCIAVGYKDGNIRLFSSR